MRKVASAANAAPVFFSGPAKAHIADLNGDCISDIVWTGVVGSPSSWKYRALTWIMRAGSTTPAQTSISDSSNTEVIAVSNFDADGSANGSKWCGKADLLKRNSRNGTDGMVSLHTASGTVTNIGTVPSSTGWVVKGVGEFNGDGGAADVLWYNTINGQLGIWTGSNGTMVTHDVLATVPASSGWTIVGVGDFNGDFRSDILWQHKATRQTSLWRMNGPNSVGAMMAGQPFLAGATVAGVTNFYDPPAPTELSYTISGNNATIKVKNNNYVKDGMGTTFLQIFHETSSGVTPLSAVFVATGTGFKTITVPVSTLGNGADTCMYARASYHGRHSRPSNVMCQANVVSVSMPTSMPMPETRPNLGFPWGTSICRPGGSDCGSFFPRVGQDFTVGGYVCNGGTATAPASTTVVHASINGSMKEEELSTPTLGPNACVFQQLAQPLRATTEQQVYVGFWADGRNVVAESYEGDNYAAIYETIWK